MSALPSMGDRTTEGYINGMFGTFMAPGDFQARNHLKAAHTAAISAWKTIAKTSTRLLADESKLPLARMQAAARVAREQQALARAALDRAMALAEADAKKLRGELAEHLAPPRDAGAAVLAGEIRTHLRTLAPDDRLQHLNKALEDGDLLTVKAAISAPVGLTGIGEASKTRLTEAMLMKVDPDRAARLKALVDAVDQTTHAFQALEQHVKEGSGIDWPAVQALETATRDTAA